MYLLSKNLSGNQFNIHFDMGADTMRKIRSGAITLEVFNLKSDTIKTKPNPNNFLDCLEWMEARGVDYVIKTESLISFIALKIWLKLEDLPTTVDYG